MFLTLTACAGMINTQPPVPPSGYLKYGTTVCDSYSVISELGTATKNQDSDHQLAILKSGHCDLIRNYAIKFSTIYAPINTYINYSKYPTAAPEHLRYVKIRYYPDDTKSYIGWLFAGSVITD